MPARLDSSAFARPLRIAAVFIAVASALWELGDTLFGEPEIARLLTVRGLAVAFAIAIAIASSERRSVLTLQWLTVALSVGSIGANLLIMVIDPDQTWPGIAVQIAITFGSAVFIPWSWRWQAALAGATAALALVVILVAVPRSVFDWQNVAFAVLVLLAVTGASALGADLGHRERRVVLESEARYRALFESAGDAIALLDGDGVIRQANQRLADLVGRPLEQLVGQTLESLHAGNRGLMTSSEHVVALTGALRRSTQAFVHADGHTIDVDISYARVESGTEEPFVQAIVHDLTERRALERREIKDQRADALEGLAGGMAHQFNNILGGILTHAGVLRDDVSGRAAAELDEILEAARRGRELTKELLRFTRSEPLSLKPTAPQAVIDSVAALARSSLPEGIAVDVRVAPDLPALHGDPDHLTHACLELVFNARDAMSGMPEGRLTLEAATQDVTAGDTRWSRTTPGRYIRLSVIDTGRGMDTTTRERVFEPFFTTKPMHRAAGMGLAKVYGIVRDHRGSIRLDSVPGRGTSVHMLLPVSQAPAPAAAPATPAPSGPATILVVDDEAIVRHSLRRALTKFGYKVLEATDGPTALTQLETANPPVRLVILDLVLPGGGAAILELLRALRPDLKVLVSSGYSPEADIVKDLVRRVEGFLPKPYEIAELRSAIAKALAG